MKFRNPENGYVEDTSYAWLWALLFGGLYFLTAGLWAPFVIWLVIAVLLYGSMGPPATILMFFVAIGFSAFASGAVRSSYLRKGWEEVKEDGGTATPAKTSEDSPSPPAGYKKCPLCAEEVRVEAIKCKHCGSMINDHLPPDGPIPSPGA